MDTLVLHLALVIKPAVACARTVTSGAWPQQRAWLKTFDALYQIRISHLSMCQQHRYIDNEAYSTLQILYPGLSN